MIGNRYLCASILACSILFLSPAVMAGSCDEYMEAIEGVVPKWNDDGTVRALVMYGEGTFLVPKRSLINKARRKAQMRAKRAFAEWMKESLHSETVTADIMEQEEITDEQGNTSGKVKELEAQIDVMRSNTNAVLSGIIKLDECLDPEEKVIIVEMGWKPSLAKAAGDAAATTKKEVERGEAPVSQKEETAVKPDSDNTDGASNTDDASKSKIKKATGYRKKSKAKEDF